VSFHLSALPDLFDFVDSVALLAVYSLHQQEVFQELKSVLLAAAVPAVAVLLFTVLVPAVAVVVVVVVVVVF
jgi:hypothetical protein